MNDTPKGQGQYDNTFQWIAEFNRVVNAYRPPKLTNILEWGAGTSTAGFYNFAQIFGSELFVTIDHHGPYLQSIVSELPPTSFFRWHHVPLSETKSVRTHRNKYFYSSTPLHYRRHFNVLFVDGRARNECLLTAALLSAPDALIMLHDFRRQRMTPAKYLFEEVDSRFRGTMVLRRKRVLEPFFAGFVGTLPNGNSVPEIAPAGQENLDEGGELDRESQHVFQDLVEKYAPAGCRAAVEWGTKSTTRRLFAHFQKSPPERFVSIKPALAAISDCAAYIQDCPWFDERAVSVVGACQPGGRDPNWHYSSCPIYYKTSFDFAYIGRERRNECLLTAALLLAENGTVILRDGDHAHYTPGKFLFDTVETAGDFHVLKRKAVLDGEFGGFLESVASIDTGVDLAK